MDLPERSGYVEGERVFGPPSGAFDVDWVASAAQALVQDLPRVRAVELVDEAWSLLRSGTSPGTLAQTLADHSPGPGTDAVAAVAVEYCALYGVDPTGR